MKISLKTKSMKRAMSDNLTQTYDYQWRVLPIYRDRLCDN